jgi:galactokinase
VELVRGSRLSVSCSVEVAPELREKMEISWHRGTGSKLTGGAGGEGNVVILPDNSLGKFIKLAIYSKLLSF